MMKEKHERSDMGGRSSSEGIGGQPGRSGQGGFSGSVEGRASGDTQDGPHDVKDRAKETAREMAGRAQEQARDAAEQVGEKAREQMESGKGRAAERLGGIGQALHRTSSNLRHENEDAIAGYVDELAHQVERASGYLRNRSVSDLLSDAERIARREPALFLGGAVVLGLVGARFFRSSSPDRGRTARFDGRRSRDIGPSSSGRYAGERPFAAERRSEDRGYAERGETGRGYAERGETDRGYAERGETDRGYVEPGSATRSRTASGGQPMGSAADERTTPGRQAGERRGVQQSTSDVGTTTTTRTTSGDSPREETPERRRDE